MKIVKIIIITIAILFLTVLSWTYLSEFVSFLDKNKFDNLRYSLYVTIMIVWFIVSIILTLSCIMLPVKLTNED